MKLLLAVDGSAYTKRMLAWLAAHTEFTGPDASFTVLTVVPEFPRYASVVDYLDPDSLYAELGEKVLHPIRQFIGQQGWTAEFIIAAGDAASRIAVEAAERKVDIVVVGSHGHTALGNVLLGSVATGVLARSKTPVLIVR